MKKEGIFHTLRILLPTKAKNYPYFVKLQNIWGCRSCFYAIAAAPVFVIWLVSGRKFINRNICCSVKILESTAAYRRKERRLLPNDSRPAPWRFWCDNVWRFPKGNHFSVHNKEQWMNRPCFPMAMPRRR